MKPDGQHFGPEASDEGGYIIDRQVNECDFVHDVLWDHGVTFTCAAEYSTSATRATRFIEL
jgi:hypothetical protein